MFKMARKFLGLTAFVTLAFSALTYTTNANAESASTEESSAPVANVIVKGNQRIEENTVRSFSGIDSGDKVNARIIDQAMAKLYETGLFADVSISVEGNDLIINVSENPIISEVAFEGNKRIEDNALSSEVKLASRSVYTKPALQQDVKRILDIYQKSGRFSVSVVPKVIQLPENRVNLVFEIDEGDRSKIARISFVGNSAFGDAKLKKTIQTKETIWYRFLSSDDTYDPDRLAFDQELLRRLYISNGYADFRVLSAEAQLDPKKNAFIVTFTLDEGEVYNFGDLAVESHLSNLEAGSLDSLISGKSGNLFNARLVDQTMEELTKKLGELGYAFVEVSPVYDRSPETKTMGIKYVIKEGPRVYVEKINILGNVRTLDEVIRREFRLAEGDPYNAAKLKRSQERINNLGFFSNVDIRKEKGSADDKVKIDVAVAEQSTGELTFGAGFSTTDGALGDISIQERNLLGRGQFLKLNLTISSVRQDIDLSFTEPYFLEKNVSAGFDIFKTKTNGSSSRSNLGYDNDAVGGTIRTSYPITEFLSHSVNYSLRSDDITDIDATASLFVRQQAGKNTSSLIGHSLMYDKRDSKFEPSNGYFIRFNQDIAGLGGDTKFFRNELRSAYYRPLMAEKGINLKVNGKTGHIFGLDGEDVRINDRFYIGSRDIRGFSNAGIGPRDKTTLDTLGGKTYAVGSVEVGFPVGLPEELGFKGAVFTDFGTLFDTDDKTSGSNIILDETSLRASVGAGLSWSSPLGPIRIDFAHAFMKESFDETESVRFSFGTRF